MKKIGILNCIIYRNTLQKGDLMKKLLKAVFSAILCISALTSCGNTTGETISTVPDTMETTAEELTTTAETILATLTDEEKEVWLSMPDIVTIRMLYRYDNEDNFLHNEIVYIDKMGQIYKLISNDKYSSSDYNDIIGWLNNNISQNEDAEIADTADIHTLIEFYNTLICIDSNSKLEHWGGFCVDEYIERHYYFKIYGISNNGENNLKTILISEGDAGSYSIQHNYIRERNMYGIYEKKNIDTFGGDTFKLYLKIDPFMVKGSGGTGHLTGEDG